MSQHGFKKARRKKEREDIKQIRKSEKLRTQAHKDDLKEQDTQIAIQENKA
jgi:hypothetical protein